MSLAFGLAHAGTVETPFAYIPQTGIGTFPSSPSLTAAKIVTELTPRIDDMEMDVRQLGSHLLYGQQTGGHSYGFGLQLFPFDLPLLKYGTEPPNYTSPSGTQAEYLGFALKYKRATGTQGLNTYHIKFTGCKCNTTELSVSSQGLVTATQDWLARDISIPVAGDIAGATWPTFASITSPALSNVDGGTKPLTINGTTYHVKDFRISWNNNLIVDQFSGSGLADAFTTGAIEITGSFNTPSGQDLLLETAIHDFPQTGVNFTYTVKAGTMVINGTGFKLLNDAPEGFSAGPTATNQNVYNFKCISAGLATA